MPTPFRARKQPYEVEVLRHDGTFQCAEAIALWVFTSGRHSRVEWENKVPYVVIDLPDKTIRASPNDYVVKGLEHEFVVYGADAFSSTFEVLDAS